MTDAADQIQTPRRMVFDWHGTEGFEPAPGDFMRAIPSGRTYLVVSARRVKVRVDRGQTLRQSLELIVWTDPLPPYASLHRFHWNKRQPRRRTKTLKELT